MDRRDAAAGESSATHGSKYMAVAAVVGIGRPLGALLLPRPAATMTT